ncbi:MAG: CRISPR-associated helicase Cas3' [Deltaproteobacteria bacterium]|nr:CRISPR-associated helicase Cas3' [Deltaproteobacteria bacterium]
MAHWAAWGRAAHGRGHRLAYHLIDVASVAQAFLRLDASLQEHLAAAARVPVPSISSLLPFLVSLHDIGKIAESFQKSFAPQGSPGDPVPTQEGHQAIGLALLEQDIVPVAASEGWLRIDVGGRSLVPDAVRELLAPYLRAVAGHHGFPPLRLRRSLDELCSPQARSAALGLARELARLFPLRPLIFADGSEAARSVAASAWQVAGFAQLCDWLGSSQESFPHCTAPMELSRYHQTAVALAERAVLESGLLAIPAARVQPLPALLPNIVTPTPLQELAADAPIDPGPELFVIEDISGGGRTAAALVLAHRLISEGHAQGAFVVLPPLSLATPWDARWVQVARRLFATGVDPSIVFAHARPLADLKIARGEETPLHASGEDSATASCLAWSSDSGHKAPLASVGVATLDQALLGVLPSRFAALRLFASSRRVLVIEDFLPSDTPTARLIESLLEFQAALGGSAILVSGGLPVLMRQRFLESFRRGLQGPRPMPGEGRFPLVTALSASRVERAPVPILSERSVAVRFHEESPAIFSLLGRSLAAGRSVAWIRNSVEDAVAAYDGAVRAFGAQSVLLLHERFVLADRLELEREAFTTFGPESTGHLRHGKLLIATQVAEAALDLDFDELVTDLAPVDVLLQRFGRLQRHARQRGERVVQGDDRGIPEAHVLAPAWSDQPPPDWLSASFPGSSEVYPEHGQLWLTMKVLRQRGGVLLPDDVRWLLESVYDTQAQDEIPYSLWRTSDRLGAAAVSERILERNRPASLWSGYLRTHGELAPDWVAPGPMGQEITLLRLGRLVGGLVLPFHPRGGWELSRIPVPTARISARAPAGIEREIADAEGLMPDRGRFGITLVMSWAPQEDCWWAHAVSESGDRVLVTYDSARGLRAVRG